MEPYIVGFITDFVCVTFFQKECIFHFCLRTEYMDFLPQLLQTVILILQNFVVLTKSGWKTWSVEMSSKLLNLNTGKKCVKNTLRSQTGLRLNVMYGEQNFLQAGKSGVLLSHCLHASFASCSSGTVKSCQPKNTGTWSDQLSLSFIISENHTFN